MADRLANFLASRAEDASSGEASTPTNEECNPAKVTHFTCRPGCANELGEFLDSLSSGAPGRIAVLDHVQNAGNALDAAFDGHLKPSCGSYIVATMDRATAGGIDTTGLQLRHDFRFVMCAGHAEPARGFLGRHLRRRLLAVEARRRTYDGEAAAAVEAAAKLHREANDALDRWRGNHVECIDANDPCRPLSPTVFMDMPVEDSVAARQWLTKLWTDTLRPRLQAAAAEAEEEDVEKILHSCWPWGGKMPPHSRPVSAATDDSGTGGAESTSGPGSISGSASGSAASGSSSSKRRPPTSGGGEDPLFNMLLHLQGAAAATDSSSNASK